MIKGVLFSLFVVSSSFAHTAIMSCFDNGDNTITCEGGFSDGSSASGVVFKVLEDNNMILQTRLSEDSDITFNKPKDDYTVVFDAGEGHQIVIDGTNILE
jgi:hypothetical protein